eukprot:scaffold32931_cov62-Phaeocystis_antarctica.AAC.5
MPCRDSLISAFDACAVSLARPRVKTRGARSICSLLPPGAGWPFPSPKEGSLPAAIRSTLTKGLPATPAEASRTCFRSSDATTSQQSKTATRRWQGAKAHEQQRRRSPGSQLSSRPGRRSRARRVVPRVVPAQVGEQVHDAAPQAVPHAPQ